VALYRVQGIVLRTYKLGETDRIVHLLSPNRGKVRAVAKGVRRPGSRFGGRLEPFSLVDVLVYEGRSLDVITQAELVTSHTTVREDFDRSACGSAMVEACDRLSQEAEGATGMFLLLRDALGALAAGPRSPALLLDAFLLRLAAVEGFRPVLDRCVSCGRQDGLVAFHLAEGGVRCDGCAGAGRLSEAVAGLADLLEAGWDELGARPPAGRSSAALVRSWFTHHLATELRSWELVGR